MGNHRVGSTPIQASRGSRNSVTSRTFRMDMSRRALLCALLAVTWSTAARAAVLDLDGKAHAFDTGRVTAVVFLSTVCPICRKSVATLNDLAAETKSADVLGVISD